MSPNGHGGSPSGTPGAQISALEDQLRSANEQIHEAAEIIWLLRRALNDEELARLVDGASTPAALLTLAEKDRATDGSATEHPAPGVRHQEDSVEFSSGMRAARQAQQETESGMWDQ